MSAHVLLAYALCGPDRGKCLTRDDDIAGALRAPAAAWLHLRADHPDTSSWITDHLTFLDVPIRAALQAPETRPRVTRIGDGTILILRGLNAERGGIAANMVSLRLWIAEEGIVSLARRTLPEVVAVADVIETGSGPDRVGDFTVSLIDRITTSVEAHVEALDDRVDEIEAVIIDGPDPELRAEIADLRRDCSLLRRYLWPQRDAIAGLSRTGVDWLTPPDLRHLDEAHDRMMRTVEVVESMRERLNVVREELTNEMSERLNRNLYILSMVSALFLPLSFLTGLMGINLAGMPGTDWPPAFWVFCIFLAVMAALVGGALAWLNRQAKRERGGLFGRPPKV